MKKTAFLFSGQGSQYIGMGKELYRNFQPAREVYDKANEILGFDLKSLCFEGDIKELTRTENTQPALLTMGVAAFRVISDEMGIEPVCMAGHSLGEFSALTCAGVIDFEAALRIVHKRGKFMSEAVPAGMGSMASISDIDRESIERVCRSCSDNHRVVVISNYNSPAEIVISGHSAAVKEAGERLERSGARIIPLNVSAPFHSPLMQPAADKFREELRDYQYNNFRCSVISNVTALPYESTETVAENLAEQLVKPVRWHETMKYLETQGIEIAVELGPQAVLRNLVKKHMPAIKAFSYDKEEDVNFLKYSLSETNKEADMGKNARLRLISRCMAIAVCTKNNNWNNEEYKNGVTDPYRRIQSMLEELEKDGREPSVGEMEDALEMLKSVFQTKQTAIQEQVERFEQIFEETGLKSLFGSTRLPGLL